MRIRMIESVSDLQAYFGFSKRGVILEDDIDLIENPTDWYERKKRDAESLTTIAANIHGKVMDIGTSTGRSAFKFASNLGPNGKVFTVNLLPEQYENDAQLVTHLISRDEIGNYFRNRGYSNVEQLYANTLTWDIPDHLTDFDAVFVDGAHDTHAVFSDSMKFWPRIKEGGFLIWHDFSPLHRKEHHWIEAVMKGVENFCDKMGIESEIVNLRESWVGILRKPIKKIPEVEIVRGTHRDVFTSHNSNIGAGQLEFPRPFLIPDKVKKLRFLVAYSAHDQQRALDEEKYIARLRGYGFDVEGFCLAIPFPSPHWGFERLDREWLAKSPSLLNLYEKLESRLQEKDVFVSWTGAMIHPEFLKRLQTFNVYICSDDPDSSSQLSKPVARYFDFCFTRNVACLELYKSWGVQRVEWLCPPVDSDFTWPELNADLILNGKRDLDTIMFCERVYGISDRPQRIEQLIRNFPQTFVRGKGWPGGYASHTEIVDAYKRAKIGWNLHNSIGPTNSRVTALPGFGIMQICDNKSYLGKIFKLDKEVVGFDTIEECIDKTRYYLDHEKERRQIALAGWRRATLDYSEPRQWERILSAISEGVIQKLKLDTNTQNDSRPVHIDSKLAKLHIGCGFDRWDGYINIDRDSQAKADLFADTRDLNKHFKSGTVAEIVLIHSLNYLTLWEARKFFRDSYSMLASGGKLIIETADLSQLIKKMVANMGGDLNQYLEGLRAIHGFGNDHLSEERAYHPNAFSWTSWHLISELAQAGFSDIKVLPAQTHVQWRDMRIEAYRTEAHTQLDKMGNTADWTQATQITHQHSPQIFGQGHPESRGKLLCLYDSAMGHVTMQTRGLMFKDEYRRRGWNVEFIDFHKTSHEEILQHASDCDLIYALKVADINIYLALKKSCRAKIIFDLTDALWMPIHQAAGWINLDSILKISDAVFSENKWVSDYGRKFNDHVYSIPVCLQPEKFDAIRTTLPAKDEEKLVVGWAGSTGTVSALELVRDSLEALSKKYFNLQFRILGCSDPYLLPSFPNLDFVVIPDYNEETMMQEILHWDIGLYPAPFGVDDFAIRGGQKAYLYMVAGVPPVCHRAGDCATKIVDGVTGMLIDHKDDWYNKLDLLLGNKELRKQMGQKASIEIRKEHTMSRVFDVLDAALLEVKNRG